MGQKNLDLKQGVPCKQALSLDKFLVVPFRLAHYWVLYGYYLSPICPTYFGFRPKKQLLCFVTPEKRLYQKIGYDQGKNKLYELIKGQNFRPGQETVICEKI